VLADSSEAWLGDKCAADENGTPSSTVNMVCYLLRVLRDTYDSDKY